MLSVQIPEPRYDSAFSISLDNKSVPKSKDVADLAHIEEREQRQRPHQPVIDQVKGAPMSLLSQAQGLGPQAKI